MDKDLESLQEVRDKLKLAKEAQKKFASSSQEEIDKLVKTITLALEKNNEPLAKMAVEETGFGKWQDKVKKNELGSTLVYESIKNMQTVGVLKEEKELGLMEVAVPVGIVAALIPSTNPTSTTMYKTLISLKSGNAIVISPHPNAKNCIFKTVEIIHEAMQSIGADTNLVQVLKVITQPGVGELMKHRDTGIILATGGSAMVKAAYSSGNPAIGVGPGNGPAFIEKSANVKQAVKDIITSKTFDNGTICASEQSVIVEKELEPAVVTALEEQGAYFLNKEEREKLSKFILRENGTMNPAIVGKSVGQIATLSDLTIPEDTTVLITREEKPCKKNPFCKEKLCPILAFFVAKDWRDGCDLAMELLHIEGEGHTMTIHSQNEEVVKAFALEKPVGRLLVNTPAALGGVGVTTNLSPALTLGCGAIGGSSTFDNVSPMNLINIKKIAYGRKTFCVEEKPSLLNKEEITSKDIAYITKLILENLNKG